jgi:hypothetical protein
MLIFITTKRKADITGHNDRRHKMNFEKEIFHVSTEFEKKSQLKLTK